MFLPLISLHIVMITIAVVNSPRMNTDNYMYSTYILTTVNPNKNENRKKIFR